MKPRLSCLVIFLLLCSTEATGPLLSENDWTPVPASQRVRLPQEYIEQQQQIIQEEQDQAQDRFDTVDATKEVINDIPVNDVKHEAIEHEQQQEVVVVEEQKEHVPEVTQEVVQEEEQKPLIVYPSGSVPNYDPAPKDPVQVHYPSAQQHPQPQPHLHHPPPPPRQPHPPPRRPQRPRRPPPPPPYQQAFPRNAPPPPPPPFPQDAQGRPLRPPPRRPRPPPRHRPRPPTQENEGVVASIGSTIGSFVSGVKCKAEDLAADVRLQDEGFMRLQLDCVLDKGPCDELGDTLKRMAPDVMKGLCPLPCDECKKKQIQRVMSTIARKYPRQWHEIVQELGRRQRK